MKYLLPFFVIGLALIFFIPPVSAQDKTQQKDSLRRVIAQSEGKDKLRAYTRLSYMYMADVADDRTMDTLMALFDEIEAEAIRQGDVSQQGLAYGNTIIVLKNMFRYDEVIRKAPGVLDFYIENKLWKYYYQIHTQLIDSYNQKEAYEKAAEEAAKMYDVAREQKDNGGMATSLYATANIYNIQGRYRDQERCLRECIDLLQKVTGYDNILTQAYAFLCVSLRTQERYDEIPPIIPEFEKAVLRFEKATGSTQYEARVNLYVALMYNCIESGEYDEAGSYLRKAKELSQNSLPGVELNKAQALILQGRKEYARALVQIDSAIAGNRDIRHDLNIEKRIKMEILAQMGRTDEAFALFDEIIEANKALHDVEVNARFDELRTRYEVDKITADKKRNRDYFLFSLGGCFLLLALLGGAVYYNRTITRKNRSLYRRIREQDRLEEELSLMERQYGKLAESVTQTYTGISGKGTPIPQAEFRQRKLVAHLRTFLLSENKLSATDMNRDELASALGTNKNTLSEAVKAVTGKTPMDYIRFLQLEEARRILDSHPELTIEAIAADCGFNTPNTFYRLFRKHYGISPAEYRRMAFAVPIGE